MGPVFVPSRGALRDVIGLACGSPVIGRLRRPSLPGSPVKNVPRSGTTTVALATENAQRKRGAEGAEGAATTFPSFLRIFYDASVPEHLVPRQKVVVQRIGDDAVEIEKYRLNHAFRTRWNKGKRLRAEFRN